VNRLLSDKAAVIYGAGGMIGGAVARTFARQGASVFLVGRTAKTLEAVAADIAAAGGLAEVAVVDALDEQAVHEHARTVASRAGSIDISFNLITRGDVQGIPLVEMSSADFTCPTMTGLTANFHIAQGAARVMIKRRSGVILTLNSGSGTSYGPGRTRAAGFHMGGTGPADAATDAFMQYLAAEVGSWCRERESNPHEVALSGF
jgi:NAD(P)-dependent dehydrogenase (short-subunit alcohol dehydrogenase family)